MPTLLESVEIHLEKSDLLTLSPINRRPESRSPGVHQSGVIRYIAEQSRLLNYVDEVDDEALPLNWYMGLAWEWAGAALYPDMMHQPGEVTVNGIHMTCDGLSELRVISGVNPDDEGVGGLVTCVEEFKYTRKSLRTGQDFLGEWLWMAQGKSYCRGYESNLVRWHCCHFNGDYRPPSARYMRHLVRFSDQEIKQWWSAMLANKQYAKKEE